MESFTLKVYRGTPGKQYWEEFLFPLLPHANVISCLMEIQRNPVNSKGEKVEPIAYESGCLEEVCGSCSMLVNGRPRQACTALIANLLKDGSDTVTLAPFTKFPLIRDLMVDRSQMFENLKRVRGWIDTDATGDRGPGPLYSQEVQKLRYSLSTCMTCGCCSEGCPNVNEKSSFIGPAPISTARLMNSHPTGTMREKERLHALMDEGGISGCGNAQNCRRVCPKEIPLTESIAAMGRAVTKQALKDLFLE